MTVNTSPFDIQSVSTAMSVQGLDVEDSAQQTAKLTVAAFFNPVEILRPPKPIQKHRNEAEPPNKMFQHGASLLV